MAAQTGGANGLTDTDVFALAIDPQTPSTVYAGTDAGGVYKSTNGGATWSAINSGLTTTNVPAVAIDPQRRARSMQGHTTAVYSKARTAA